MNSTGKILIVDDERLFIDTYRALLGEQGYEVEVATDAEAARTQLAGGAFSVVVLDQKLEGSIGPDSGLDLLREISVLAPAARIIVATAYASKEAIKRAFDAGAYDYLEKNPKTFDTLLGIKIRNAIELYRERSLARIGSDPEELRRRLGELWQRVKSEADRQIKGRLLEELVALVFRSVPGFEEVRVRQSNRVQEIDVVVANQSTDPLWSKEGALVLVECKNQKERVEAPELLAFEGKMRRFRNRCTLGFFVAPSGFTKGFMGQRTASSAERLLVVPIDEAALDMLVSADDRNAVLKKLFVEATGSLSAVDK